MKSCPWCAEQIQDAARICRHCQRDVTAPAQPSPLDQGGRYDVPIRFEQQTRSHGAPGGGGAGFTASSSGIALKGHVCPRCRSTEYVTKFSIWHGVLAIGFFPIGLLGLFFPVKACVECGTEYGAGRELTRVLGMMALGFLILVILAVIGIGVLASS